MSVATCPYCREPVDSDTSNGLLCPECGTPHHLDCFEENGGCTVFGCSAAPTEEPKLLLAGNEVSLGSAVPAAPVTVARTPPPPKPRAQPAPVVLTTEFERSSILFGSAPPEPPPPLLPEESERKRTMFLVLGVTLGAFGAHSFYGGYRRKAFIQLGITLLSLGLAAPMVWVWAIIDVCTIDRDSRGAKFAS